MNSHFFPHKTLSYKLIGLYFEIHREYGPHHNERIYHSLLIEKLNREKIPFRSKPKVPVFSKDTGKEIGFYVPDFLVNNCLLVELKVSCLPLKRDEVQLSEYLKTTPFEVRLPGQLRRTQTIL